MIKALRAHPWLFLGVICVILTAGATGYFFGTNSTATYYRSLLVQFTPLQEQDEQYPLVAPLLGIHAPQATELGQYQSLKNGIQGDISSATAAGGVNQVSVYFRDLDTSQWIGINQDDDYYPASLLKVPVMIAYYKEAEADPSILDQQIVYQNVSTGDPFDAPSDLTPGKTYSVNDLINAMIIDSDNGATLTLLANVDQNTLDDVYANLGITNPGDNSATYQIATHTYALFFRILYNATYLDAQYSQKALDLLSQATFSQGLVAGLPSGITAAHKFGEHVLNSGDTATGVELSDCGVIYYPDHPYLLCVMTSTNSVPTSESVIKDISATTYAAVDQEYATTTKS